MFVCQEITRHCFQTFGPFHQTFDHRFQVLVLFTLKGSILKCCTPEMISCPKRKQRRTPLCIFCLFVCFFSECTISCPSSCCAVDVQHHVWERYGAYGAGARRNTHPDCGLHPVQRLEDGASRRRRGVRRPQSRHTGTGTYIGANNMHPTVIIAC